MSKKRQLDEETEPIEPSLKKRRLNNENENDVSEKNGGKNKNESAKTKTKAEIAEEKLSKWSNLEVGDLTKRAIDKLGFANMMEIQYKAIPPVLVCILHIYNPY